MAVCDQKRRITIPNGMAEEGDEFVIFKVRDEIILKPMTKDPIKIFEQLGIPHETSARTHEQAKQWGGLKAGTKINRAESLFPRLDAGS